MEAARAAPVPFGRERRPELIDEEVRGDVRLAEDLARTCDIQQHVLDGVHWVDDPGRRVGLHPSWHTEPLLPAAVREAGRIGRADLAAVASECRRAGAWAPLLAAANAWSYGESGYGHWRTRRTTQLPDVEVRLQAAVATLDADGPVDAYYQLNNEGHLHGWGPQLFTVFLHFADDRRDGRAMILDGALAAAVNALVPDSDIGTADWGTAEYAFYLGLLHRIAAMNGVDAATAEAVLWGKFRD